MQVGGAGVLACLGGGAYVFGIEPVWLRRVECRVPLRGLHPAFEGYTVAQLSDFHVGAGVPYGYLRDAVAMANEAGPDLVALTGDFIHRGRDGGRARDAQRILAGLRANDEIVAVTGNHDAGVYRSGQTSDAARATARGVADTLQAGGIRMLEDDRLTLRRGDASLHVAGFRDLWTGGFDAGAVPMGDPKEPTIALSHNPDTAPELAGAGAALILAGHTHGGQVRIPFLGPPILPVRLRRYSAGLYRIGETHLYVNRGIGWLRRVRLFVRPEVTIFTFKAAS